MMCEESASMNSLEAKISFPERKVSADKKFNAGTFLSSLNSPIKNHKVSESLKDCLAM